MVDDKQKLTDEEFKVVQREAAIVVQKEKDNKTFLRATGVLDFFRLKDNARYYVGMMSTYYVYVSKKELDILEKSKKILKNNKSLIVDKINYDKRERFNASDQPPKEVWGVWDEDLNAWVWDTVPFSLGVNFHYTINGGLNSDR